MPIRVGYSPLSEKFYAFSRYRSEVKDGREILIATGEKFDVTQDIASAVILHDITFSEIEPPAEPEKEA